MEIPRDAIESDSAQPLENMPTRVMAFIRRRRRALLPVFYVTLTLLTIVLVTYDASLFDDVFPAVYSDEQQPTAATSTTTRRWTMGSVFELPFVPRDFRCDEMHQSARRNFTYPEGYLDHADAYKSALELNNLLEHAVPNEQSWLMQDIGRLPFVRTVCETGFYAGHNAFHFLTANPDVTVHSFEDLSRFNFTLDLTDFMIIEFPDRFFVYTGNPETVSILKFVGENGNKTSCDVVFVDSSVTKETLRRHFELFKPLASRRSHLVITNAHPLNVNKNDFRADDLWQELKAEGSLKEHFRCYFEQRDASAAGNQMGLLVGSYVF